MPPCPRIADSTRVSIPCFILGAQAARSPIFGAPPSPLAWHFPHCASTICLPLRATAMSFALAGSFHLPPDWFTMYATARPISRSVRSSLPPCEGMDRMPFRACSVRLVNPWEARLAQALWSPIFGAPLTPLRWQFAHTAFTTSLPLRSAAGENPACASARSVTATSPARLLFKFVSIAQSYQFCTPGAQPRKG